MAWPLLLTSLLLASGLDEAQDHLNHGRYAEAIAAFQAIDNAGPESALGLSRAFLETGEYKKASVLINQAIANDKDNAALLGRQAEIAFLLGDWDTAETAVDAALKRNAEQLAARLVRAKLLAARGRIEEASKAYRWFVRYYNRAQPTDPDDLRYIALGSLQYARWKNVSPIFHFVINTLCPDIKKAAPDDWRASAIAGSLLLEKYNVAQGRPELDAALAINPHAADVHAKLAAFALAKRELETARRQVQLALQTNPRHIQALGTLVDLAIIEDHLSQANETLDKALVINPIDQELLARKVALLLLSGKADFAELEPWLTALSAEKPVWPDENALANIMKPLVSRNPRPGLFLAHLGQILESLRRFDRAERLYQVAAKAMPQLSEPRVALGLLAMRNGDILAAETLFESAFESDPFNVRVNNVRQVINLLKSYDELETDHFRIRFNGEHDRVLAELMAIYLEDAYDELTSEFGFEPPGRTVVEIFSHAQGESGHQWFSARMVGLPWLHTIGASTGSMLALATPTKERKFNWAETVRHEFVHVITLQQTDFRIPHWYTEALAVRAETFPRPDSWNELLRRRVPSGKLDSLDELNRAFVRPESSRDWTFAYCQSLLYAQYIDKRFGPETHRAILAGYANGLSTKEGFTKATGVSIDDFESGYRDYLKKIAAELGPATDDDIPSELKDKIRQALAAYQNGNQDEAIAILESQLHDDESRPNLVALLGRMKLKTGDAKGAAQLFAAARKRHPHSSGWLKMHAAALIKAGDGPAAGPLLEQIAESDPDDALAAKRLAELAIEEEDFSAVRRWCLRALHVTPGDAQLHRWLAQACKALGQSDRAAMARRHAEMLSKISKKTRASE